MIGIQLTILEFLLIGFINAQIGILFVLFYISDFELTRGVKQ